MNDFSHLLLVFQFLIDVIVFRIVLSGIKLVIGNLCNYCSIFVFTTEQRLFCTLLCANCII